MNGTLPDLVHVDQLDTARTLLHPIRLAVLRHLREPHTCAELAERLQMSPQRINNHLKALLDAALIRVVKRDQVRNLSRATYQAAGKVVWLSPKLARDPSVDDTTLRDRLSLDALLGMAEDVQTDVATLLSSSQAAPIPSLGLRVDVHLRSEAERAAFARDVLDALAPVVERYQGPEASPGSFCLNLMCYPQEPDHG